MDGRKKGKKNQYVFTLSFQAENSISSPPGLIYSVFTYTLDASYQDNFLSQISVPLICPQVTLQTSQY